MTLKLLDQCDALLVTGGEDVYPAWYQQEEDTVLCEGYDRRRDTLELKLIERALELKMPLMGICRGHQITNVALGGSLIPDIPSQTDSQMQHRCDSSVPLCLHEAEILPESMLYKIVKTDKGQVTSYHHQSVDRLASLLKVGAKSADGIVEAIEWKDASDKGFLLGVQWHPERMQDYPELSVPIGERFVLEARKFRCSK